MSAQENAGNPHYIPAATQHRAIRPDEMVLIDLWGKLPARGAVFADIAWVGFTGAQVPDDIRAAFAAAATDGMPPSSWCSLPSGHGRELRGYEVDRACRAVLERAGFGASSSTAPGTAWARRCTEMASTWTTTRPTTTAA